MKTKILLTLSLLTIVCAAIVALTVKKSVVTVSNKLNPEQFGANEITSAELTKGLDGFYPFPSQEKTYMVNHGKGWWYVPYTGTKLQAALANFGKAHPELRRQGSVEEIAMQSRYSVPLPLDKYDYDPSKGSFVLFASN